MEAIGFYMSELRFVVDYLRHEGSCCFKISDERKMVFNDLNGAIKFSEEMDKCSNIEIINISFPGRIIAWKDYLEMSDLEKEVITREANALLMKHKLEKIKIKLDAAKELAKEIDDLIAEYRNEFGEIKNDS